MPLRSIAVMLALLATVPARAACLDLPDKLLMFTRKGPSVNIVGLDQTSVALIKLDCTLTAQDWRKLALPRHVCTDAPIPNPGGGQCKVIELTPLTGEPPNAGDFEYVVRRNLAN